jgi:tyrosinase
MNDPSRKYQIQPGAMNWDQTAPRDPVFYRWHKFVDVLFEEHRRNLKPHKIRDLDFPGIEIQSFEVELEPEEYHKKKVDKPLDKKNNFYTYMDTKEYTVFNLDPEKKVSIKKKNFLDHIPFRYKIILKNKYKMDAMVLLRIFLAPETDEPLDNWRNMFIELDRFVVTLDSADKKEIYDIQQRNNQSSVIRKPQLTVEDIESGKDDLSCGNFCGWPLNLLIPRGTKDGMKGTLFILASDWTKDGVNPQETMQGPISYCGLRGESSVYPDIRPMGFPFDREVVDSNKDPIDDVAGLVELVPNSFKTDVQLNYLGEWMSQDQAPKEK